MELDDLNQNEIDEIQAQIFAIDDLRGFSVPADDSSETETPMGSDTDTDAELITSDFKAMFSKLDVLLSIVLEYIRKLQETAPHVQEHADLDATFYCLMEIFESTLLPTHHIKATQFIMFYVCSIKESFADQFLGLLVTRMISTSQAGITSVAASQYLGSFIARANYLPLSSVRSCLRILNNFAKGYVVKHEAATRRMDIDTHAVFFSAVQSILYIFCFHHKALMAETDPTTNLTNIRQGFPPELRDFQTVLISKFQPLVVRYFLT